MYEFKAKGSPTSDLPPPHETLSLVGLCLITTVLSLLLGIAPCDDLLARIRAAHSIADAIYEFEHTDEQLNAEQLNMALEELFKRLHGVEGPLFKNDQDLEDFLRRLGEAK